MNDIRYGIFLRPDPATCWTVTQVTLALNKQFGLVSAAAFPPHVTLIGNLHTNTSSTGLISALDTVFDEIEPFPVFNHGIERNQDRYGYNLNKDAAGAQVNIPLAHVASAVAQAVAPLSVPVEDYIVTPIADYKFAAHLGLAAHELTIDNRLSDEVGEFLAGLPITPPVSFVAKWYSLFELRADWSGHWWEDLSWEHLHSWHSRRRLA